MRETVTPFPRYDQYTAEQLLDAYQAAPARLRATLAGLTLGELRQHPRPGKWSAMEIVVHMTDSELVGAGRIRLAIAQPGAPLAGYDQDTWAESLRYQQYAIEDLNVVLVSFSDFGKLRISCWRARPTTSG